MQLRWDYPTNLTAGAWGPTTSNHNFCEEDYNITPYIGEFVNTLTNIVYVIYGAQGLRRVQRHKDGGLISILAFPYWGLIGVGLLSAYFHATLKYHSQMCDDLSMFLAVGSLLHQLMCYEATPAQRKQYTVAILGSVIPVSIYHVWADEIYVHEVTFAIMIFLVGRRLRHLITRKIKTEEGRNRIRNMLTMGLGFGLFGYFLWNIDFHLCNHVTAFKHRIGLPWGFIFELHGWWHFGTSVCSYISMSIAEYLTTIDDGDTGRIEEGFIWPVKAVLRDLDRIERKGAKKVQ